METNKLLLRAKELNYLCGDYRKINKKIGWKPKIDINQLIKMMINFEREKIQRKKDFKIYNY